MPENDYIHNARLTRQSGLHIQTTPGQKLDNIPTPEGEDSPIQDMMTMRRAERKNLPTNSIQPLSAADAPSSRQMAGEKVYRPFTQEETSYIPLHTAPAQACANCRFFHVDHWDGNTFCHIVESYPEPILVTGWCNEWRATMPMPEPEPLPVVLVNADDMGDMGNMDEMGEMIRGKIGSLTTVEQRQEAAGWFGKIADMIRGGDKQVGFKISEDGKRWEALYTNNWRDDTGELFPGAKIDAFINRVYAGLAPWPELQYGHLSATTHGRADGLVRIGHHVLAVGSFDESEMATKFKEFGRKCLREGRKLALSHRFWFNPDEKTPTGEYGDFDTFEISWFEVLPDVVPANPFTVMEMKTMEIPAGLVDSVAKITGDRKRAEELVALSLVQDERAMQQRREAKTAPVQTPPEQVTQTAPLDLTSLESKLSGKFDQMMTQMTDMSGKVTAANTAMDARVTAIETTLKGMVAQAKSMQQLAPPPRSNPLNLLNPNSERDAAVAKYLSEQEQKSAEGGRQSLIEYSLGIKVNDQGIPTQITGGQ